VADAGFCQTGEALTQDSPAALMLRSVTASG